MPLAAKSKRVSATIWQSCGGADCIQPIRGTLYRLVESQEQVATMGYVDTLEEQALLEELLENAKPQNLPEAKSYHYLLKTPFRYPPLQWGSRFGRIHEPGIFYGGASVEVLFAETAYYRFLFWDSMQAAAPKDYMRSEHSLFSAHYKTEQGVRLQQAPFDQYTAELTHKQNYSQTQKLGSDMRDAGVQAFEYQSSRSAVPLLCVGLFTPKAFSQKKPSNVSPWFCQLTENEVTFKQKDGTQLVRHSREDFCVSGELPLPAA
ncbi:MAG: RES family NAD+ phosphorylase [Gammaproteobacteria bacterium]|nr:RES family NAD+ phosphorylase [Gammaproteobacteria bacterium]